MKVLGQIWDWADVDQNGSIDLEEYKAMFRVLWECVVKETMPEDIDGLAFSEFWYVWLPLVLLSLS